MAKLTLTDITNISGAEATAISNINNNSDAIETALENTLSRDGTTPNSMSADLDINSNDILNANQISTTSLILNGSALVPSLTVVTDSLLNSNNLSDVNSSATSRTNLDVYSKSEVDDEINRDSDRNRITNPCMQISQERGDTAGSSNGYHMADEWFMSFITSAGVLSAQRIQSRTLSGALDRSRVSVTTADTSLAAGEFLLFQQRIEGSVIADAEFGTSNAKDLVVRFMGNFPAGTYTVALRNSTISRSFVREITAVAGVDTVYEVVFPGDTTGTWPTGDVLSMTLTIGFAVGSTFQTTKDAWQAGNFFGTAAASNGLGAIQSFDIGDVGLRVDFDSAGSYGNFKVPNAVENKAFAQRYLYGMNTPNAKPFGNGQSTSTTNINIFIPIPVPLRTTPTITLTLADQRIRINGSSLTPSAMAIQDINDGGVYVGFTVSGATTHYAASIINAVLDNILINARM